MVDRRRYLHAKLIRLPALVFADALNLRCFRGILFDRVAGVQRRRPACLCPGALHNTARYSHTAVHISICPSYAQPQHSQDAPHSHILLQHLLCAKGIGPRACSPSPLVKPSCHDLSGCICFAPVTRNPWIVQLLSKARWRR